MPGSCSKSAGAAEHPGRRQHAVRLEFRVDRHRHLHHRALRPALRPVDGGRARGGRRTDDAHRGALLRPPLRQAREHPFRQPFLAAQHAGAVPMRLYALRPAGSLGARPEDDGVLLRTLDRPRSGLGLQPQRRMAQRSLLLRRQHPDAPLHADALRPFDRLRLSATSLVPQRRSGAGLHLAAALDERGLRRRCGRRDRPTRVRVAFADFLARELGDSYAGWYAGQCPSTLVDDYQMRLYRIVRVPPATPRSCPPRHPGCSGTGMPARW